MLREERMLKVSENRVLRGIFWPKRVEVTRERRRLHIGDLCVLYFSTNTILMIKSRGLRWVGHVASMVERIAYRV
jgi:hypothetical protein